MTLKQLGTAASKFWRWITTPFRRASSDELIKQEWGLLYDLWLDRKSMQPPVDATVAADLDTMFEHRREVGDADGWAAFNKAERRVGSWLTQTQLKSEFETLLDIAKGRSLSSLARHEANEPKFGDPDKEDEQRVAYKALLGALQSNFIDTRFRRRLRSEVAMRLFRYGVVAVLVAIAVPLALVWNNLGAIQAPTGPAPILNHFGNQPLYLLAIVAAFGLLGAYFSRVMAFNANIASLTFDNVMDLYVGRMLRLRMLYGMIGALVFYFVLRGGLVGGTVFPVLENVGIGEQIVWRLDSRGAVSATRPGILDPAGLTILAPTADMAKLLIWSFIAGFSERLVPDTITRTEARATSGE
ncbi:MAG TPA: hypothetical protein VEW71_04155 [Allosphingosinicella sp.]|nr:hypothetical protein [Allosphingosinicella sp.]